ncbi:DUF3040 domain-containing protein [Streptomyces sp. TG1A-8]|uniref:DUF3040 domain-containing protein n=1 Tax=Streptomyces sp. TG1A-8 TaxID=3051385 RepID=UPI00265B86D1|nr:DUF3040 domain-containing protein [Streptomyces sp. TG1A-8]MDO0929099.1 DUF3040 domain-containing protein [Streptomyces sp. TG1A-8]
MDDWETPDDVRLSPRERITLLEIEARLRRDRLFTYRMRRAARQGPARPPGPAHVPGRAGRPGRLCRLDPGRRDGWLWLAVLLLAVASAFVAVMGIRSPGPALLWCFALLWPLTLLQAFRLLCRATRGSRHGGRITPWF